MTDHIDITRFVGDEGRDRLASPSINAPHTADEAWNAILRTAIRALEQQSKSIASTSSTMFGPARTQTQADWLTNANEHLLAYLRDALVH